MPVADFVESIRVSEVIRTAIAERIEKRRGDLTGQSWSIGSGLKV